MRWPNGRLREIGSGARWACTRARARVRARGKGDGGGGGGGVVQQAGTQRQEAWRVGRQGRSNHRPAAHVIQNISLFQHAAPACTRRCITGRSSQVRLARAGWPPAARSASGRLQRCAAAGPRCRSPLACPALKLARANHIQPTGTHHLARRLLAAKEMDIGRSRSVQEAFLTEALRLQVRCVPHWAPRDRAVGSVGSAGRQAAGWQRGTQRLSLPVAPEPPRAPAAAL